MTLQELKISIEDGTFKPTTMILVSADKFIPLQYIEAMRKSLKYSVSYIESLSDIRPSEEDIFGESDIIDDDIIVYNTNLVDFSDELLYRVNNLIIVTNEISKSAKKFYEDLIIEIPKLAEWQVKDMVYSLGRGVDTKYLDWVIYNCNCDINRLYQEMLKLSLFSETERVHIFDEMIADGAFEDVSANTVFNFTNAILKKDFNNLKIIYEEIDNMDVNDFGLLTILYNNFMNVVNIQMGINPTAEALGMSYGQFNAIKHSCGYYSANQLVNIVKLLSSMDRRIKSGEFPTDIMRDYLILSVLSQ